MIINRNVVPPNNTITIMGIVLNSESDSNLIRMVELLFKLNVLPTKVLLENSLINYMLVNRNLTDQE